MGGAPGWWRLRYRVCWGAERGKRGYPGSRGGMEGSFQGPERVNWQLSVGVDCPRRRWVQHKPYFGTCGTRNRAAFAAARNGRHCQFPILSRQPASTVRGMADCTVQCRLPLRPKGSYQVGTPGSAPHSRGVALSRKGSRRLPSNPRVASLCWIATTDGT